MNYESLDEKILNARLFAKKCISDKLKNLNPKEYILLQISKFILLKERLIKKDYNENLHFNYDKYHEYMDVIKEIGDTLIKNASKLNIKKVLNVIISPSGYDVDEDLQYYILLLHKLRDCLAHGSYYIDFENNMLIIYNFTEDMDIISKIPISLIEKFTYIKAPLSLKSRKDLEKKHKVKLRKVNHELFYNNQYNIDNINNNPYIYNYEYLNTYINETNYDKKSEYEILKALLLYANKVGLPHKDIEILVNTFKKMGKTIVKDESSTILDISSLVEEISSIIGLKSKELNPYAIVAVYNYMQIYLANNYDKLWNNRPELLSHLRLHKLHPMFTINPLIYKQINDCIKTIVKRTRKALDKYNLVSNPKYKEKILTDINKAFDENIKNILRLLSSRNMEVITGIRNSIEHGNIVDIDGRIVLFDKEDQKNNKSINFVSISSCENYYDLIETLDLKILTPLTNEEIIEELKDIVDHNILKEFEQIIIEIKELNDNKFI